VIGGLLDGEMPKKAPVKKAEDPKRPLDLRVEDVGCPICLDILVEPITMPCDHKLCKPCFAKNLDLTSLECPFCKVRISIWARRAGKNINTLIDQRLWSYIQETFGDKVKKRLEAEEGDGGQVDEDIFATAWFTHNFVETGEIKKEFQSQKQELEAEDQARKDKDELKSQALIKKLLTTENEEGEEAANQEVTTQDILGDGDADSADVSDVTETPAVTPALTFTSLDTEIQKQKRVEELIAQQRLDEELARKLQAEEEQAGGQDQVVTRNSPKRGKENKQKGNKQSSLDLRQYYMGKPKWPNTSVAADNPPGPSRANQPLEDPSEPGIPGYLGTPKRSNSDSLPGPSRVNLAADTSEPGPSGDSAFSSEYLRQQQEEEERIAQRVKDERLARLLQQEEEKMVAVMSSMSPNNSQSPARTPKRPHGPRQMTMEDMAKRRRVVEQ